MVSLFGIIYWNFGTILIIQKNDDNFDKYSFNYYFFICKMFFETIFNYNVFFILLTIWCKLIPKTLKTFNLGLFFGFVFTIKKLNVYF